MSSFFGAPLALDDNRPLTGRRYAYDMLRWFRLLWFLDVPWNHATQAEATAYAPPPDSVNPRTSKPYLRAGYPPATINHNLTVVSSSYALHRHHNRGPLLNPVPESAAQRRPLAHRHPHSPTPPFRRTGLRQRVHSTDPQAIPDPTWDLLFAAMTHDRDRSAVLLYVSSGSRASELLKVTPHDID